MNLSTFLWEEAAKPVKKALPLLSFPAVQKMGISVHELVSSADNQAKAMKIVADEVPSLASVTLMDLSVEAEAFGATVRFAENEVPTITGTLVSDEDEADALVLPEVGAGRTGLCLEAVRKAKETITDRPVLAGVIGPYSLAGRLLDVTEILYQCYDEPELVHKVLSKVTDFLINYINAFKAIGADGVVLAEPLAGLLSPELFDEFSKPYVTRLIESTQEEEFSVIYHNCGNAVPHLTDSIFAQGAAAYHFGNAVNMREILDKAPKDCLCMGNIDPAGEFAGGTVESMQAAVVSLMENCGKESNFLPSSGCDIPPKAKWENIHAFFDTLAKWEG